MSRIAPKLLTALFVLGCGSGAMASPNRGQWTDSSGNEQNPPSQGYAPQGSNPSQGYSPGGGYQAQGSQGGYQAQGAPSQGAPPPGYPSQGNPSQGGYPDQGSVQPPDQDQEEDFAETEPVEGQGKLGILVISVTPELRRFFGVASDRGVLVARVEPNSPAARAGIQVGDVLVRVGPQVVRAGDDVVQAITARQGGRIRIAVVRQGRSVHLVAFVSTGTTNQNPPFNQNQNPPFNQNQNPPFNQNQNPPFNQNQNPPFNQNGQPNGSSQNQL
jgi:membrane-associated protease RseP (regulator of RpoE activity)